MFDERLEQAVSILKEYKPSVIYLFGSAGRNELREDSDIDIAFLTEEDLDEYDVFMKAQDLADILKKDVDLINLKKASTVFKAQVVGTGKIIYCSNDSERMFFEMRSLKSYALLNEEREEILKNVKKRGTVYGE